MLEPKRTLLDLVSGGKYKTSRDMPSMLDMGVAYNSWVNEGMDKEVYPGVTSRDLYDIVIGSGAGVVKTASTATKLFTGWRDNLSAYMLKASKKERKIADYIIRKAMLRVDESDVRGTQNLLNAINTWFSGNLTFIPEGMDIFCIGSNSHSE